MIQQGHKYSHFGAEVIAVGPHPDYEGCWRTLKISDGWIGCFVIANEDDLEPLPMKYFQGQVPCAV